LHTSKDYAKRAISNALKAVGSLETNLSIVAPNSFKLDSVKQKLF